ncbi:hypothetical protein NIES4101_64450 [Calothrix sp. NIES-4101]|nr:hypothetical protein NIES4101_64450 [Calothrix sp. NIES-4101]
MSLITSFFGDGCVCLLTLDAPEEIKITPNPNTMVTATVEGGTLKQEFNPLENAAEFLKD